MPGYFNIAIMFSVVLILAVPSHAEFYQYVDNKGIIHYTDNISTIPAAYQSQVGQRHETNKLPPSVPYPEFEKKAPVELKTTSIENYQTRKSKLLDKMKALDNRFEQLVAEKQHVEQSKKDADNKENIIRYNQRVREVNEKIRRYRQEEKLLMAEIQEFNESIGPLDE